MALEKDTNSYVTVDEADSYFENRLDVAAWSAASDDQKAQALITATNMIDLMDWTGVAISESQSLAFPREGSYFDPKIGTAVNLTATVPDRILKATQELAYHLLNNDGLLDETGSATVIEVGRIKLEKIKTPKSMPYFVKNMVRPLLMNGGSNVWWRAN